jgi:hypothetical protein
MKTTYIHEINTLHASNGELYIGYGDDNEHIVFNTDTLFKDLHIIIDMVCKENKKEQKRVLKQLKTSLNNI